METNIQLVIGGQTKRSTLGQHPVNVDWNGLPDNSQEFVIKYGLKQFLADAMAGASDEADAGAKVKARLDKLVSGDLSRTRGEGADKPDTLQGRFLKLARANIRERLAAAGKKADKEAVADAAKKLLAVADEHSLAKKLMAEAKKQLAAEAKAKEDLATEDADDILADLLMDEANAVERSGLDHPGDLQSE